MNNRKDIAAELREALWTANNKIINRFGVIQQDIHQLVCCTDKVDDEIKDLFEKMDGNINDLINKTKDLNNKLPQ